MSTSDKEKTPLSSVVPRKMAREALAKQGVFTMSQLALLPIERLVEIPGIGLQTAPHIHALANAIASQQPYWIGELAPSRLPPGLFLDIRVDPDTRPQLPWGFGYRALTGTAQFIAVDTLSSAYQVSLDESRRVTFAPDLETAWQELAEVMTAHQARVYYWGKVIRTHLQQTAPLMVQHQLKPHLVDLHPLFTQTVAVPVLSTGLQPIANFLGYRWQKVKAPYEAHIAYLFWMRQKRLDLLRQACFYMEQNMQAIHHIWHWLTSQQ